MFERWKNVYNYNRPIIGGLLLILTVWVIVGPILTFIVAGISGLIGISTWVADVYGIIVGVGFPVLLFNCIDFNVPHRSNRNE